VDVCDTARIEGWVFDADTPDQKLTLEVFVNGSHIGECSADIRREDLAEAGLGDGNIAFSFLMPDLLPASALDDVVLRIGGTDICLPVHPPGTPRVRTERPPTLSQFGGLWIDRTDWIDQLALKHRTGELDDDTAMQIYRFVRDGFLVIPAAVPMRLIATLNDDIDRLWTRPPEGLLIETFEPDDKMKYIAPELRYRTGRTKLLDPYYVSDVARRVTAARAAMRFLSALFGDMPMAFQQLAFWRSPEQAMHKDSAYVKVESNPMALAATWLALEDVVPGTGELEYFVGSHRSPEFLFGGVSKWAETYWADHERFLASIQEDAEKYRYRRASFQARAGDLIIWHADLAHGDARVTRTNATRRALLTHFAPARETPFYRAHSQNQDMKTETCVFVSQYGDVK
jgi:hypothetical protein